jgi:hypothetical protein
MSVQRKVCKKICHLKLPRAHHGSHKSILEPNKTYNLEYLSPKMREEKGAITNSKIHVILFPCFLHDDRQRPSRAHISMYVLHATRKKKSEIEQRNKH